jgi:hypothetical protein
MLEEFQKILQASSESYYLFVQSLIEIQEKQTELMIR